MCPLFHTTACHAWCWCVRKTTSALKHSICESVVCPEGTIHRVPLLRTTSLLSSYTLLHFYSHPVLLFIVIFAVSYFVFHKYVISLKLLNTVCNSFQMSRPAKRFYGACKSHCIQQFKTLTSYAHYDRNGIHNLIFTSRFNFQKYYIFHVMYAYAETMIWIQCVHVLWYAAGIICDVTTSITSLHLIYTRNTCISP